MRRRICVLALGAAVALASALANAGAVGAADPTNFRATVVVPMTSLGGGSAGYGIHGQTTDAFPRVGRASVDAVMIFGACSIYGCTYSSYVDLVFEAPTGDTFLLRGSLVGSATPVGTAGAGGTWSVDDTTGRFVGLSGSGTYSYTVQQSAGSAYLVSIYLRGTFSRT